jgi:signal transduction histidine kinase
MRAKKDRSHSRANKAGGVTSPSQNGDKTKPLSRVDKLRFEEMERLNRHLIEVSQLKDEFLANTSHELRTPLNSIIGFLTLITEGYYDDEKELKLFTRNALDSAYHLLSVINDLLDLSKIESGRIQLQIEKVYVDELLSEVCSLFSLQANQKGLGIEVETRGSPLFASADLRKLKQVLINLMANAIKFTAAGSVKIIAERQNGTLCFSIKDTGIGIPKEKQNRLFQKFLQLDGSTTRRFGGTGLGLVISKHLVEMMGGQIRLESKGAGMGTTAHFTVPRWIREED